MAVCGGGVMSKDVAAFLIAAIVTLSMYLVVTIAESIARIVLILI
jgi:hypothetical protein